MSYSLRFHPLVARDLDAIARWIIEYADAETAERKLSEIEQTFASLVRTPHKSSIRNEVAPGLRAIPAGRSVRALHQWEMHFLRITWVRAP